MEGHRGACDDVSRGSASRNVDDEWSFIQTLRHLNFASAAWVGRMVLGTASPWHPLDLPWDEAPGWDGIPWDREARPSLDEVLTVRRERQAMVRHLLESLTDDQLATEVTRTEPGWPRVENFPVKECLRIVLNEEWQHRLYAERDLDALETPSLTTPTSVPAAAEPVAPRPRDWPPGRQYRREARLAGLPAPARGRSPTAPPSSRARIARTPRLVPLRAHRRRCRQR